MCFSATASFAAAGVTSIAGGVSLGSAKQRSQLPLVVMPLLFAILQLAEGVLWLALSNDDRAGWQRPAMFTFLTVARVVWPVWVPLAILTLERQTARRRVLSVLLALGAAVTLTQVYGLATYPVTASIAQGHIRYGIDSPPVFRWVTDVAYVIVTVLPPFVSSVNAVRWLGLVLLVSLVVSKLVFYQTFISVWCFFAALISAFVVVVVKTGDRESHSSVRRVPSSIETRTR